MAHRTGFVAVLGRPNAGKSTLVNRLVGRKVSIVTPRPQTTRNRIQGIVTRDDSQVIFTDTPGLLKPGSALDKQMMEEVAQALDGTDLVVLIVDAHAVAGPGDAFALDIIRKTSTPAILLLNKIDLIPKPTLLPLIDRYSREHSFAEIIPVSALNGGGLENFLKTVIARLPEGPPLFPSDQFTDQPERFLAAEIIREKAITATRQEIPYALAVLVEGWDESPRLIRIRATLFVERDGQKGILIGKGGAMLKRIGTAARRELEKTLGVTIFLELFVKVQRDWREKPALVRQLDWRRQLESLSHE